tara:strand:+ start:160 stop:828 length:669 start_codon:yes stop_codon:yes gene_type:complete
MNKYTNTILLIIVGALVIADSYMRDKDNLKLITIMDKLASVEQSKTLPAQSGFDRLPKLDRTLSVAAHLTMRGLPLNEDIKDHLIAVEDMIIEDANTATFYEKIGMYNNSSTTIKLIDELTIKLYDEWTMAFKDTNAPLRNKFPKMPYLAVDNEIIAMPVCEENKRPQLFWVKATRNNQAWVEEPTILEDLDAKRWLIKFTEAGPVDITSRNKRLVLLAGCA